MTKTFLTSDTHFFHENVIKFCNRPFGSVEEMNYKLIQNWNLVVGLKDHVWFLGDFSFGKVEETKQILQQLNGIKHLVTGNHDRKGRCQKLPWKEFFVEQHDYFRLKVGDIKAVLCHFPLRSWERGYYQFHGHCHTMPHESQGAWMQHDIGVDNNNYTPLLLEDAVKRSMLNKTKPDGKYN